ncbi:hypothetical protein, partial [Ferrimicrobium sp.]|uniref:hypothetical protein n=1 Tax=Ferrimicrobium sp. TaxID=2926050 RepID=UPI0026316CF3
LALHDSFPYLVERDSSHLFGLGWAKDGSGLRGIGQAFADPEETPLGIEVVPVQREELPAASAGQDCKGYQVLELGVRLAHCGKDGAEFLWLGGANRRGRRADHRGGQRHVPFQPTPLHRLAEGCAKDGMGVPYGGERVAPAPEIGVVVVQVLWRELADRDRAELEEDLEARMPLVPPQGLRRQPFGPADFEPLREQVLEGDGGLGLCRRVHLGYHLVEDLLGLFPRAVEHLGTVPLLAGCRIDAKV